MLLLGKNNGISMPRYQVMRISSKSIVYRCRGVG